MVRRVLTLLLALVTVFPATSHAAVSHKKAIWGPAEIDSESQFPVYRELGAGIYQTTLDWSEVQSLEPLDPSDVDDPSYEWPDELDTVVSEAKQAKITVAVTLTNAPRWANGNKGATTGPTKPADFATFAAVAAKRYPSIHLWSVWDGPYKRGASAYARVLDATYAKLKAASSRSKIVGGNSKGSGAATWIARLKLPNGKRPRMDFYGHDISAAKPPTTSALKTLERRVDKLEKGLDLYLSPVSLNLTPAKQATWLKAALKATKSDPRVYTFGYRGLVDNGNAKGLLDADGTKRASFAAFENG